MKKHYAFVLACAISLSTPAQMLQQLDIAPDWTATDINGGTHHLYDYLDQGYTVFLDFSATWCGPCWENHLQGALRDTYLQYGPGTAANKIMVLFVEGDPNTGLDALQGTGGQTAGDWITGTPYPIIDDASVAQLYGVTAFPTTYIICPNRYIRYWLSHPDLAPDDAYGWSQQCDEYYLADTPNDVSLLPINPTVDDRCAGPDPAWRVRLQNTGTAPLEHATIHTDVLVDQDQNDLLPVTYEWSGLLQTYEYVDLAVAEVPLPTGQHLGQMTLVGGDDQPLNDVLVIGAASSAVAPGTSVTLHLLTDDHGPDMMWQLSSDIPGWTGPEAYYGSMAANTLYTETWDLENDRCYSFQMATLGQNGLAAPGYFDLSVDGTSFSGAAALHYNTQVVEFRTDVTAGAVSLTGPGSLSVAPNPMDDRTTVDLSSLSGPVRATLYDATGRQMRLQQWTGGSNAVIERGTLLPGCYVLALSTADGRMYTTKLLVQ